MMRPGAPMRWPLRGPVLIGALALVLLLGGFGSWAMLTRLDGAILAGGQVAMPGNRRVVHHPEGGVVAAIAVAEGTQVAAGDVLLTLDGTALRSDLALLEAQIYELLARQARLEAERDGKPVPRFDARLRDAPALRAGQARLLAARTQSDAGRVQQLRTRAGQVQDQITGLKAQQAATRAQQDLVAAELSALKTLLDKGLAPAARLGALQREAARLQGVAGDLSARIAEARGRITEVQIEINAIAVQRREEAISQLRDLRHRLLELEEHQGALQSRLAALHLRAPVAGTVHDLRVFGAQAVLRPAEPVATIIPRGRPGVVMADISPLDIDRVVSGMRVTLRLPALGRDPAAERTGHVVRVSADAFEGAAGQRFFRAEITLDTGPQATSALLPGMPVQVFIRTGAHSPLAYLTAPMRGYLERALRD